MRSEACARPARCPRDARPRTARPSATRDEIIVEVVAEASNPGTPLAPAPAEDLFEKTGSRGVTIGETENPAEPEPAGDEKWEFDEAPSAAPHPGGTKSRGEPAPAPASDDSDDLDSLGSPEGWDLLGGVRESAAEARFHVTGDLYLADPWFLALIPPALSKCESVRPLS